MITPKPMRHFVRALLLLTVLPFFTTRAAIGQEPTAPSARDIWEIGRRELGLLNEVAKSPQGFLIQSYTQYIGAREGVLDDSLNLARASLGPNGLAVVDLGLPQSPSAPVADRRSWWRFRTPTAAELSRPALDSRLRPEGVAFMIFPDTAGVGMDRYSFQYLGDEDLGTLHTWTFMLTPRDTAGPGAFSGKIWVADHNIVRFSGAFTNPSPKQKGSYLSFDSIRFKAESGRWLPWRTYVDQTGLPPSTVSGRALRGRITVWGFNSVSLSGLVHIRLDQSVDATHVSGGRARLKMSTWRRNAIFFGG